MVDKDRRHNLHSKPDGSGAIAQGEGATVAGERGVAIGGDAHGPIVTGDHSKIEQKVTSLAQRPA
jgi:hypothetical protein